MIDPFQQFYYKFSINNLSENTNNFAIIATLLSGVLGAVVGGGISLIMQKTEHLNQKKREEAYKLETYKVSLIRLFIDLQKMAAITDTFKRYIEKGKTEQENKPIDWGKVGKHVHNHEVFKFDTVDLLPIAEIDQKLMYDLLNYLNNFNTISAAFLEYNKLQDDFDEYIGANFTLHKNGKIPSRKIKETSLYSSKVQSLDIMLQKIYKLTLFSYNEFPNLIKSFNGLIKKNYPDVAYILISLETPLDTTAEPQAHGAAQ